MIQIQVYGDDMIHGKQFTLPAVPRVGDRISFTMLYRVVSVTFSANDSVVVLWVEKA